MQICNSIVCLDTRKPINLNIIARTNDTCKYNPKKFPGISLKITKPKTTLLIFKTGKLICTGAKSFEEAKEALNIFLKQIHFTPNLTTKAVVANYVGSGSVNHQLDLHKLYKKCHPNACYEPELFPAMVFSMKKQNVTALVFNSGKYILTGSKYLHMLNSANFDLNILLRTCLK